MYAEGRNSSWTKQMAANTTATVCGNRRRKASGASSSTVMTRSSQPSVGGSEPMLDVMSAPMTQKSMMNAKVMNVSVST